MAAYRVHDLPGNIPACARLAAQGHPPGASLHLIFQACNERRPYYR